MRIQPPVSLDEPLLPASSLTRNTRKSSKYNKLKGGYPHQVRLWLKTSDEPVILIDDAKERTKPLV